MELEKNHLDIIA